MRGDQTLFLHDVLFTPIIHQNLISVRILIKLGFNFFLHEHGLDMYLGKIKYGTGYFYDRFFVLDVV